MASEEHQVTDTLKNAEDDSESEIQETLAGQAETRETLGTVWPPQLKQDIESNTSVRNGMISSSSSLLIESSNETKTGFEPVDCHKEPNSVLEEVLANATLKDKNSPTGTQKSLPMEGCNDPIKIEEQFRIMVQGDQDLVPSEKYLSGNVFPEISEVFDNIKEFDETVSVINNAGFSDMAFTSCTVPKDKDQLLDLVIDIASKRPSTQIENNCILEDISPGNFLVEGSVIQQTKTDPGENFVFSCDVKIPPDSVQSKTIKQSTDDLACNVASNEEFRFDLFPLDSSEDATKQQFSCLSVLQDSTPLNSSGKMCKTTEMLAQSSTEEVKLMLEQSPTKNICCTDTLFNFCNINDNESRTSLNSKSELKSIAIVEAESDDSFPLGRIEPSITTDVRCENSGFLISLLTDEYSTINEKSNTSSSGKNNNMEYVAELESDNCTYLISDKPNTLNLSGDDHSSSSISAREEHSDTRSSTGKDEKTLYVFENKNLIDILEDKEQEIKTTLDCQDSKHILLQNDKLKSQFSSENELNTTLGSELKATSENKISSTVSILEDDNSSLIKKKNNLESSEVLEATLNELQRIPEVLGAPLPSISEKDPEEPKIEEIFEEMEFNLQNSPMLRRSRQSPNDKSRRDCRFIFGEDNPVEDNNSEEESSQKPFVALRDSLDIVKLASALENNEIIASVTMDEKEKINPTDVEISCTEKISSASASIPHHRKSTPPQYQSSKLLSRKKTSIKADKEKDNNRRVSFPEDDSRLITSYLEPVNPWYHMNDVSTDVISEAYKSSCTRHKTRILPVVLQQIAALPVDVGGRIECLNVRNQKLEAVQCESLEEIFRRVQFHTLDFENCELDDDSAIPLFDMMEFYDSAVHINISHNNKIGNRGWQACARMLKRSPSLRILEARNTNLSEQNMPIICKALRVGTHLHTLHLENCNLTGRPLVSLVGALRLNDTVTDLYLADNRLGINDCIQLGNLVRANKVLKLLDLRNNNIQDSGCGHICKDIAEQQNIQKNKDNGSNVTPFTQTGLTTLVLWNNHITVQGVQYISLMLHSNYSLEMLNLGRNNLTSEGLLLLKTSLLRNKSLQRIGLQATRIGNEGAVALAECIADNQVLSRIDLRENSIQVAGLLALSRSLKINNTVIQLDLDANPRAEPSTDLSEQHLDLFHEIKNLCQRNLTNDHLRREREKIEETKTENSLLSSPEKRKISLTCETTTRNCEDKTEESSLVAITVSESKRYRSPDPSPSVSPCPSPSLSPSPSPVPSPLKNRFKVCKVAEDSNGASYISGGAVLSTSAPAFFMHNPISRSLPSLVTTGKPNRFSTGGRFTVTKVTDSNSSFKSSLPCNRAMSSPSLIVLPEKRDNEVGAPTIVVSSPNKAVRGFSVKEIDINRGRNSIRNTSLDLPISVTSSSSPSSDSSSPQDDVFLEDEGSETCSTPKEKTKEDKGQREVLNLMKFQEHDNVITQKQTFIIEPEIQRAPLASVEGGSVDSDSEDSDLMTQSSDSTRSDEVRISVEDTTPPLPAWGGDKREIQIDAPSSTTSPTSTSSTAVSAASD